MLKLFNLAFIALVVFSTAFGQDKPVPDYVVKQDFPDSVKIVSLVKQDGTRINLGDALKLYHGKKVVVDIWASWCRD